MFNTCNRRSFATTVWCLGVGYQLLTIKTFVTKKQPEVQQYDYIPFIADASIDSIVNCRFCLVNLILKFDEY